jgi:hypothetical protein
MRKAGIWVLVVLVAGLPGTALAYIGPGAGLSAGGSLLVLIGAVVLTIVGFIWYPLWRLRRRWRARAAARAKSPS